MVDFWTKLVHGSLLHPYAVAAFEQFISEGYIGGILQIAVDEVGLLVVALKHHELILQFSAGHTTLDNLSQNLCPNISGGFGITVL